MEALRSKVVDCRPSLMPVEVRREEVDGPLRMAGPDENEAVISRDAGDREDPAP